MGFLGPAARQARPESLKDRAFNASTSAVVVKPNKVKPANSNRSAFLGLALGSAGVVYGDIGTSPLYAFKESISHVARHGAPLAQGPVVGVVSLMLWTLMIIVTL